MAKGESRCWHPKAFALFKDAVSEEIAGTRIKAVTKNLRKCGATAFFMINDIEVGVYFARSANTGNLVSNHGFGTANNITLNLAVRECLDRYRMLVERGDA